MQESIELKVSSSSPRMKSTNDLKVVRDDFAQKNPQAGRKQESGEQDDTILSVNDDGNDGQTTYDVSQSNKASFHMEEEPALEDVKFNFDDVSSMSDKEIKQSSDNRGYSLLMLASEAGRLDVVQCLIDRGEVIDTEIGDESAISLAYAQGHHEVVLKLLKENAKFPLNFESEAVSDELKIFFELCSEMHEKVRDVTENEMTELKSYLKRKVEQNPKLNHFYHPSDNVSLLKRAILCKKFSLYKFLLALNIFLGSHESMDEINESLTRRERRELSDINLNISPDLVTEPMMILMRNCKLGPDAPKDRDGEFMFFIRQAFDSLFMIPALAIILKIVAASRNFKIIFDFRRDSVTFLDPKAEPFCEGLMYLSGKIYIGAKDLLSTETAHKTVSTIAHELTHYAMCLIYGNWAKPYKKNNIDTIARFNSISEECEREKESEELIELVFDCYEEDMRHAELIVRVPHLIAFYQNNLEIMNTLRSTFQNLFDFYEQVCVPEMERALPSIEKKYCPVKKVEKKIKRQKYFSLLLVFLIISGSIFAALGIYWILPVSWTDLSVNEQNIVKDSIVNVYGIDVKFGELFTNDSKVFDLLSSEQNKMALKGETEELSKALNLTLHPYVYLMWWNMTHKLKDFFLRCEIEFQGQKLPIGKVINKTSTLNLLSSEQVRQIFTQNNFTISSGFHDKTKIYIERFFIDESFVVLSEQKFQTLSENDQKKFLKIYKNGSVDRENMNIIGYADIIQQLNKSKAFLLSSAAGDGKSTTFRHFTIKLKEQFPLKWIQFIDLKKHIEVYEIAQTIKLNNLKIISNFLGSMLLKLDPFELKVFKEFFNSANVIFLWDGIDEIAPRFKDFMLDLTEHILNSENVQFISTRPQHSSDFKLKLGIRAYKLIPFSELNRFEFLVKTIAFKFNADGDKVFENLKGNYKDDFDNLFKAFESIKNIYKKDFEKSGEKISTFFKPIEKARRIFEFSERMEERTEDDRFVSNPLLISMISEISADENFKFKNSSFNSFQLYENFIERKLGIIHGKGRIVQNDTDRVLASSSSTIWKIHQFYALKLLSVSFNIENAHLYHSKNVTKLLSPEEISRFGILQVNSENDFDFAHRTFAEFFAAQFYLDNVIPQLKRYDIKREEDKQEILSFLKLWSGSKFNAFIEDASELDKNRHIEGSILTSLFTNVVKNAYSNNLYNFENVLKFIQDLTNTQIKVISYIALYKEMKSYNHFDDLQTTLFSHQMSSFVMSQNISHESKNLLESISRDLSEKSKKGLVKSGIKIKNGDYQEIIQWDKKVKMFELRFDFTISDIVKYAYANDLNNFENVLKFIRDLPDIDQSGVGFLALYDEMKSNDHLESFSLMMMDFFIEELIKKQTNSNTQFSHKDKILALKDELKEVIMSDKSGIDKYGIQIKNGEYNKVIEWAKIFNSYESNFEHALPELIKSVYSNDLSEFLNVLKFIRDLPKIYQSAVGLSALYEEMKSCDHHESFQLMIFAYSVKEVIEMPNYPHIRQNYKEKFESLKNELEEGRSEGVKESGAQIRSGDFPDILKWAKKLTGSFEHALPELIISAYSNDSTNYEYIFYFCSRLPFITESVDALLTIYDLVIAESQPHNFELMMIAFQSKEYIKYYPNIINQSYKDKLEILVNKLRDDVKKGIELSVSMIKEQNDAKIIEWRNKIYKYGNIDEGAYSEIIKSAYSNDSETFFNILNFSLLMYSIEDTTKCISVLYDEMKVNNYLGNFHLMMLAYEIKKLRKGQTYNTISQYYKDKLKFLKNELEGKRKQGVIDCGAQIRNESYQKIIEWCKKFNRQEGSFELALPDLIKAAYTNNFNEFLNILEFLRDLPSIESIAIGSSSLYNEMMLGKPLESYQFMMLAYAVKELIELKNFPNVLQQYRDKTVFLKKDIEEKRIEGIQECASMIKKGDYQKIIEWGKKLNKYEGSFELAIPDLIKAAYSSDLDNFEKVLKFVQSLPYFSHLAESFSALYNEMNLNNHIDSSKLKILLDNIKKYVEDSNFASTRQSYKDKFFSLMKKLKQFKI